MKKYQYILFDWDGNLARTLDVWLEACREAITKQGVELTDEQIAASFGSFIPYLKKWGIKDPLATMDEIDQIAKQKLPEVELYPDALEVLEDLHELGKQMALITTSTRDNVEHLLVKYNLMRFFEVIVAGDEVANHKPHPEPLEKALDMLGGNKDDAVMIGDSDKDVGAAHNTGVASILFFPEEHAKFYDIEELRSLNPTHLVSDFREIVRLV